jgi:hypothetical protein
MTCKEHQIQNSDRTLREGLEIDLEKENYHVGFFLQYVDFCRTYKKCKY